jgi:phosphopantothenate synthetase
MDDKKYEHLDLITKQQALEEDLDKQTTIFESKGFELNKLKGAFDRLIGKKTLEYASDGKKRAVTLINKLVQGDEDVISLKETVSNVEHEKEVAQVKINNYKLKMRMNEEQIKREWGRS